MLRLIMFFVAMTLAIIGTLIFMAGNRSVAGDNAHLIGTGCFMFSGLFWCLFGFTYQRRSSREAHGGAND